MATKFFRTRIVGAAKIKADLMNLIPGARDRLRTAIESKANDLVNRARSNLSGGVLNQHTGYLYRAMRMKVDETPTKIVGRIYNNAPHAHLWEQGWGGKALDVKAHVRRIKAGSKTGIVKATEGKTRTRIRFGQTAQGIAFVKAHSRKMPRQQKSFLKSALDEIRGEIYSSIRRAMFFGDKKI